MAIPNFEPNFDLQEDQLILCPKRDLLSYCKEKLDEFNTINERLTIATMTFLSKYEPDRLSEINLLVAKQHELIMRLSKHLLNRGRHGLKQKESVACINYMLMSAPLVASISDKIGKFSQP